MIIRIELNMAIGTVELNLICYRHRTIGRAVLIALVVTRRPRCMTGSQLHKRSFDQYSSFKEPCMFNCLLKFIRYALSVTVGILFADVYRIAEDISFYSLLFHIFLFDPFKSVCDQLRV